MRRPLFVHALAATVAGILLVPGARAGGPLAPIGIAYGASEIIHLVEPPNGPTSLTNGNLDFQGFGGFGTSLTFGLHNAAGVTEAQQGSYDQIMDRLAPDIHRFTWQLNDATAYRDGEPRPTATTYREPDLTHVPASRYGEIERLLRTKRQQIILDRNNVYMDINDARKTASRLDPEHSPYVSVGEEIKLRGSTLPGLLGQAEGQVATNERLRAELARLRGGEPGAGLGMPDLPEVRGFMDRDIESEAYQRYMVNKGFMGDANLTGLLERRDALEGFLPEARDTNAALLEEINRLRAAEGLDPFDPAAPARSAPGEGAAPGGDEVSSFSPGDAGEGLFAEDTTGGFDPVAATGATMAGMEPDPIELDPAFGGGTEPEMLAGFGGFSSGGDLLSMDQATGFSGSSLDLDPAGAFDPYGTSGGYASTEPWSDPGAGWSDPVGSGWDGGFAASGSDSFTSSDAFDPPAFSPGGMESAPAEVVG